MKDQSQIMNQKPQPQMMTQQLPPPPQKPPQMMTHHPQMMMNQPPMMTQRSYGMWPPPSVPPMSTYQNPKNPQGGFVGSKPRNWKGKKRNDKRRMDNKGNVLAGSGSSSSGGGYRPPALNELQHQNRMKARRFFNPKKKFNNRFAPYAPRNTTSFLIRAKKSGGITSLVSPGPVTPAVLPTPIFSPSREVLGDMAKEEWGVDGYGSMKGLIRLRSPGGDHEGEDDEDGGSSSDSDVEEHVEVERRLDHDLSRFEMIYPNCGGVDYNNVLENRVDDQDTHIAQLEEENLILKERLFLMEREIGDLRRRLQYLERRSNHTAEEINEEVVDNVSENDSESRDNGHSMDGHNEDNRDDVEEVDGRDHGSYGAPEDNFVRDVCMNEFVVSENQPKDEAFTENQPKDEVFTENQPKDDVFTENQPKDEIFTKNHPKDEIFTKNHPKDEVFTENQPKDDVLTRIQPEDEVLTKDQPMDDVFTRIQDQPKDGVFARIQPKDEVLTKNQPKEEIFSEDQSKDENCCVEKNFEVNDDACMECVTNMQVGVAAQKDEPKNTED